MLEPRLVLAAAPISDQFLVNETVALEESQPAIAVVEDSGDFVAAWTSFEEPGGDQSGLGVYAQRFHADGSANGPRILVNAAQTEGDQLAPSVAVDASGNFIVAWQGYDADGTGVFAQRFEVQEDGTVVGTLFPVNDYVAGDQLAPSVAMDNAGHAVIAWESAGQDGAGYGVFARRYDVDGTALGTTEFPVSSLTEGDQLAPSVAMARGTGHFVIAWEGQVIAAETSVEVFAHLYEQDGDSIAELQVNDETLRDQVTPHVAMDFDGDLVVTWTSEGIPGSGSDIFARRVAADGTAAGPEFQVNVAQLQGQRNSKVALDDDGDFFVSWQSSHQDEFSWGIFGRAFAANGTPLTTDLQVNTYAEEPQTSPALAGNSAGQLVALWLGLDEDHASAVHAQRYQLPELDAEPPLPFSPVGQELVLANYLGLEDSSATAGVSDARQFLVAWQSYGVDGSGLGIMARRVDATGNPLPPAFVVNTETAGNQTNPDVAVGALGNAVVVWESADQDGSGHGIYAQRFDQFGNPVGTEFQVNEQAEGHQSQPSVAINRSTGEFVVAWQSTDGSGEGVVARRFYANGQPATGDFFVNDYRELDQVSPEVAMNDAGQFAIVWVSDHQALTPELEDSEKSIFVQAYDAAGVASGSEQLVHEIYPDFEAQEYPDIALDALGNMTIVWQSINQDGGAWGVFGRQLLADKTPLGEHEFQVNQTTAENQRRATVVADPAGNFTVSWQSDLQDQSATAIVSRQFHADGTPETDEMLVNTWQLGPQILPVMAMTPSGDFGVFWDGQGLSRTEGVHGRIYEEGYVPPPPHIVVAPVGDQFLVSEAAGLEQSFPAVAVVESSGDYVAAWTSFEQPLGDESGLGIYAQRFHADGSPIDPKAFLVNTTFTADDQTNPVVAVDDQGRFVIAWQSLYQDGSGFGIYAQRFDTDAQPVGSLLEVNHTVAGNQTHPAIAMDNSGDFVIVWESDGQDGDGLGIYARRYTWAGQALDDTDVQVNSTVEGNQSAPTVSWARTGGQFVIGWQSEVLGDEGEVDVNILATLFQPDWSIIREEFPVNTILSHDQVGPQVAMAANGQFVVAWTSEGQMGSGADVYARRFDANGIGLANDFRVNETTPQGQQYPAVGIDGSGNFLVSWQSSHQDGFSWGIFAKAYAADQAPLTSEFQVNTNVQGPQTNPALNANSEGDAVVVWLGLDAGHKPAVHAQRYELRQPDPELAPTFTVGPEGEVVLGNYSALEDAPASAAVDGLGNYVVAWQSYGQDGSGLGVYARRFDAAGQPLDPLAFQVNTTTVGNQSHPAVAAAEDGSFTIVWQAEDDDGYGIFAQRYGADGARKGGEFRVNDIQEGQQGAPAIAIDPDGGSTVIVWQGPDGSGSGIFGRRYNPAGKPVGTDTPLNTFTQRDQVAPTISINDDGYVVAWVSDHRAEFDPTDTEKSIFARWFHANGTSIGDELLVHSIQPEFEAQEHVDVALDSEGNAVFVWQSINQDGNTWGVFARQFLADRTPVQPLEFQVNQTVLAPQRHPSVAVDPEGNFVVAWQGHAQDRSGPGVFARVYDAAAVPQTDEFLVPTWDQGPQTSPQIAMTEIGDFGVFWTGHGTDRAEGVHGRIYGQQHPDLQVEVSDDDAKVAPGGAIEYTISTLNAGNADASGVVLTAFPDALTTFDAAASTPGWESQGDGTFTYSLGTLEADGVPRIVQFVALAPLKVPPGVSKLQLTIVVSDDGTAGEDQTLENNTAVESTPFIKRGHGRLDVNQDGKVTPADVARVINALNRRAKSGDKVPEGEQLVSTEDVNGDDALSPVDALILINYLNGSPGTLEGEQPSGPPAGQPVVTPLVSAVPLAGSGLRETRLELTSGELDVLFAENQLAVSDAGQIGLVPSYLHGSGQPASELDDVDRFGELDELVGLIAGEVDAIWLA